MGVGGACKILEASGSPSGKETPEARGKPSEEECQVRAGKGQGHKLVEGDLREGWSTDIAHSKLPWPGVPTSMLTHKPEISSSDMQARLHPQIHSAYAHDMLTRQCLKFFRIGCQHLNRRLFLHKNPDL